MSCGEKSGAVRILTVVLTICIILGAIFVGIRPTLANAAEASEAEKTTARAVNVQTMHRENGRITGASYLMKEEFMELFGDMASEDEEEYPMLMCVDCRVCKVRAGAGQGFEIVGLLAEGEEVIALEMTEGSGNQSWYRVDKESLPEDMEISAEECYIRADLLREK